MTPEQLEQLKLELADDSKQVRDVFNENLQNTFASSLIRRLSIQPQISKKVFVPLVMQIPFDPFTGKTTGEYTMAKKWVVVKAPDKVMAFIKEHCDDNPEVKDAYMRSAGYKGVWDTSDHTRIDTPADKAVMWIYRRPMAYTFPVTTINNSQITGTDFGQTYLLPTKQDPMTGAFTGDLSFMHSMASMVGALAQTEVKSFTDALKNNNPDNLCKKMGRQFTSNNDYLTMSPDSKEAKDRKRDIRKYYPMSSPYSAITLPVLAFDLTPRSGGLFVSNEAEDSHELLDHFKNYAGLDPEKFLYYNGAVGIREEVDNIVGNYFPRNPAKIKERNKDKDLYPNWVVLDYVLNDTKTELTKEEKFALSQRLKFTQEGTPMYNPIKKVWEAEELEGFVNELSRFFEMAEDRDFVRTIRGWIASEYQEITPAVEEASTAYVRNFLHPKLPVYNANIHVKYTDFLAEIFPDEQATFILDNQDAIIEKGETLLQELLEEGAVNEGVPHDEADDDDTASFPVVE